MSGSDGLGLLSGVRVVELDHAMASSLVGMLMAEQGAEVVRVMDHDVLPVDPVLDALLARGKTEVALDATDAEDLETLDRLLAQTDVVLVDDDGPWRELDVDAVRAKQNPGLISCSLPAFPEDDPRSDLPGHEAIAGAAGLLYSRPIGMPRYHTFPIGSITAGLYAVNAVMAALVARLRIGRGQHVEASSCHGNYSSQVLQILIKAGVPRGFLALKMIGSPFMRCWLCKDERFVYLHITIPAHNARMLQLLEENGHQQDVARLRAIMSEQTIRDPSQVGSIKEAKQLKAIYSEIFMTRTADEWEEILGQQLCCIKVRHVDEWLRDSLDAGMTDACELDDPVLGRLLGPGPLVAAPDHPPVVRPRTIEANVAESLLDAWEADPRPAEAPAPGEAPALRHPLEGIKVLDLSRIIAGPCAARVLAELGAEVMSVQSDTRLDWALSFHLIFNAGKRSVTLDFTDDEGKEKLWKLMDWYQPDAFINNYRHLDLAREIGVGPEAMLERFPGLAYTHLNAYGDHGVWKDRPGFEQVVQAVSGMQMAYAQDGRPKLLPSPIIDIGCGLLGAFGTLLSIYHQRRTGQGAVATTHLTSVSVLLQLLSVSAFQREGCLERARARGLPASHDAEREVLAGIFWALGRKVLLCGPRCDLRRWMNHAGLAGAAVDGQELEEAGRQLWKRPVSWWQRSMVEAGVQDTVWVVAYPNIRHIVEDVKRYDPRALPVIRRRSFPGSPQQLTFVSNPARMSLTPLADIAAPPERGADTAEILGAAGVDVPPGSGPIPYPPNKPLAVWLASFIRWGYFAWKSGNI